MKKSRRFLYGCSSIVVNYVPRVNDVIQTEYCNWAKKHSKDLPQGELGLLHNTILSIICEVLRVSQ